MNKVLALSAAALFALAGCATEAPRANNDPTYEQAATDPFLGANYDAADKLLWRINYDHYANAPILVATFANLNDLTQSSAFGRAVAEQFVTRLVVQNYNVKELKLRENVFVQEGTGELMLSREVKDIARSHSAAMVLVGTYTPAANMVYVNTKLVRAEDGRILGAYDYTMPVNRNIRRLLQTQQ